MKQSFLHSFQSKGLLDVLDTNMRSKGKLNDHVLLKKMNTTFKKESCYITNSDGFSGFRIQHYIGEVSALTFKEICRTSTTKLWVLICCCDVVMVMVRVTVAVTVMVMITVMDMIIFLLW